MLRPVSRAWLAACATLGMVGQAHAQQELQVALDVEDRVYVVDQRMAAQLGVFQERFPDLREVRLFLQLPDTAYVLEVTLDQEGRILRERVPLTDAEARELRADLTRRIAERAPTLTLDRDGRHRLIGGTALAGLLFYGWAVPVMLDVDDEATAVGLYMLTAGSSFFGPWIATRNRPVSRGMASLSTYGATRGILHGLLLHELLAGGNEEDVFVEDDARSETAAAMALSVGLGLGGYVWAERSGVDLGTARTIGLGGDFGMLQGLWAAGLADAGDRAGSAMILAGGGAGIGAGRAIAARRDYSPGDVTVLATAGYLGAYTGIALVDLASPDSDRGYAAGGLVGGLSGLVAGDRLVRSVRFTEGEGRLISLGTLAGGAVGLGTAYLLVGIDNEGGNDSAVYLGLSTLGAAAGYALTYRSLTPGSLQPAFQRRDLRLQLHPAGLAARALGSGPSGDTAPPAPVVTGSYRF